MRCGAQAGQEVGDLLDLLLLLALRWALVFGRWGAGRFLLPFGRGLGGLSRLRSGSLRGLGDPGGRRVRFGGLLKLDGLDHRLPAAEQIGGRLGPGLFPGLEVRLLGGQCARLFNLLVWPDLHQRRLLVPSGLQQRWLLRRRRRRLGFFKRRLFVPSGLQQRWLFRQRRRRLGFFKRWLRFRQVHVAVCLAPCLEIRQLTFGRGNAGRSRRVAGGGRLDFQAFPFAFSFVANDLEIGDLLVDLVYRGGGRDLPGILVLHAEDQRAHGELVLRPKRRFLDPLPSHQGPVQRTQIPNRQQAVNLEQLAVFAADHGMDHGQVGLTAAADDGRQFQQDVTLVGLASDNNQFRLHGDLLLWVA